jgi:hypothetical protein
MIESRPRIVLLDPAFRPVDRHGKFEVALALWLELALNWFQGLAAWFAARPLTTFAVWSLWLSALYFCLGPGSYVKVPDCGNGTLPSRMISAQEFMQGELGNWMYYSGCGTDRVLNNFRLEPQCILFALLPGWLGYGLIMLAQRFLAGYFFYRLMRDDLKTCGEVAILTGLSYSLFHQIGIHWQWDGFTLYDGLGIPCLPLLVLLTNRFTERRWWQAAPGSLAMGVGLALSSPYFQTLFFPFLAVFWFTWIQPAWTWKRLALLTLVFVGWAAVTAPEMYGAMQYLPLSHRQEIVVRSDSPYVKYIENVQHWPGTVWKSNKLYLAMAGLGLAFSRFRDRRVIITALAVAAILGFVSRYHYFNDQYLSRLGILSSFHFHRFIYLTPFLCSLAMGLGFHALPQESLIEFSNRITTLRIQVYRWAMVLMCLVLLWVSTDVNLDRWSQVWRGENFQSLYRHPDLLALAERKKTEPDFRVACITDMWRPSRGMHESHLWTVNPGVAWAYGLETTDGYQVLYSLRYKQFWSEVILPLMSRDELRARQHVYWGNMVFLWHPNSKKMEPQFETYYNLDLLSLANTKYLISPVELDDPDLMPLPSASREQHKKWEGKRVPARVAGALRGDWPYRPIYIYENRRCLPRFFLAPHVVLYDEPHSLMHELRHRGADSMRRFVHLDRNDLPVGLDLAHLEDHRATSCDDSAPVVTVAARTSDRLELECEATQECLLFLSYAYSPYWKATLNSEPSSVLPANHAFMAVHLPEAGKHRVVLTYEPPARW